MLERWKMERCGSAERSSHLLQAATGNVRRNPDRVPAVCYIRKMRFPKLHDGMLPRWAAEWIVHRRLLIVAVVILVSIAAAFICSRAKLGNSMLQTFMGEQTSYDAYQSRIQSYGGHGDDLAYLVTQEGDALFTAQTLNAIRSAAEEIRQFPEVQRVDSLADAVRYRQPTKGRVIRTMAARAALRRKLEAGKPPQKSSELKPYWPLDISAQKDLDFAELKEELLADPFLQRTLLSADGQSQGMVVRLKAIASIGVFGQIKLRLRFEETLRRHGLGATGIYCTGMAINQAWLFSELAEALLVLTPICLGLISLLVWIMLRRFAVLIAAVVIVCVAMLWAVAITTLTFNELSVLVAATPLLVIVIGTSDVIHLATAYQNEMRRGREHFDAIVTAVQETGSACILTSATSFVGFMSLATVPVPATRQFAFAAAVGCSIALMLALTLLPAIFFWTKPAPRTMPGPFGRLLDRMIQSLVLFFERISLNHSWKVIGVCIALLLGSTWAATKMGVKSNFSERFPYDHPVASTDRFVAQHFLGATGLELFIKGPPEVLFSPHTLRQLATLEVKLEEHPSIKNARSVLDHFRIVDSMVGYGSEDGLPNSVTMAKSSVQLLANPDGEDMGWFVRPDFAEMRMILYANTNDLVEVRWLTPVLEKIVADAHLDGVSTDLSGTYVILGDAVWSIIGSQVQGFVICFTAITFILSIAFQSVRNAVMALAPNLLPLMLLVGFLSLTMGVIDSDILGLPDIALGIAVDDTIHFMHRYHIEFARTRDRKTALHTTMQYTGPAIMMTTVILCVGFSPCIFSDYFGVWVLGTYLSFSLAMAVLAELLLTPAMVNAGLFKD